jgi:hypothetical protein
MPKTDLNAPYKPFQDINVARAFFQNLNIAGGAPTTNGDTWSLLSSWSTFIGWDEVWDSTMYDQSYVEWAMTTDMATFGNSFLAAAQKYDGTFLTGDEINGIFNGTKTTLEAAAFTGAQGKGGVYQPYYEMNPYWLAVDMITCLILIVAAVCCFWLRTHTVAPDVFGYVSSMTRDNPYLHLPEGGTAMSGVDRARALKKIKVRIADMSGDAAVGHIGLTVFDEEKAQGLSRDRQYV